MTLKALPELVPARMLNEFVYCPRLGFLEWVEGELDRNEFTEDGLFRQGRVESQPGQLGPSQEPEGEDPERPRIVRSVTMSAPVEGLIARMDLVESQGRVATPVDTKRGKAPDVPGGAYDPERVQLCAQGLILRENGYPCEGGFLYFVASRKRVWIPFDEDLVALTRESLARFREVAQAGVRPPPLRHSPKCGGCSLSGICLPDEVGWTLYPEQDVSKQTLRCYLCKIEKDTESFTQRVDDTYYRMCQTCVTHILQKKSSSGTKRRRLTHTSTTRQCYLCDRIQPVDEFTRRSNGTYFSACKSCNKNVFAHRRRSRLLNADGEFTSEEWLKLLAMHQVCPGCHRAWEDIPVPKGRKSAVSRDHIQPLSKGGANSIDNIQPLCYSCNSRKSNKTT